jgi:hypothetical protein
MKIFFLSVLVMNIAIAAETNPKVGAPANAVSRGRTDSPVTESGAVGVTKQEQQAVRKRAESMGGAPEIGAGMGTGTGAGSTVGKKIKTESDQ